MTHLGAFVAAAQHLIALILAFDLAHIGIGTFASQRVLAMWRLKLNRNGTRVLLNAARQRNGVTALQYPGEKKTSSA